MFVLGILVNIGGNDAQKTRTWIILRELDSNLPLECVGSTCHWFRTEAF